MRQSFKLILLTILFAVFSSTLRASDYTFTNGIVFAKIIGPNKWSKETGESKFDSKLPNYFYTTIEVVSTKDDFLPELKGRNLKVRTGDFDKLFIGKTVAIDLIRRIDKSGKARFSFSCSELRAAMMLANWRLKQQK